MIARRVLGGLLVSVAAAGLSLGTVTDAVAADGATIAHVETTDDGVRVLVSVPPGSRVDLDGVTASLDGSDLEASAASVSDDTVVERTAVLAIDTSNSMRRAGRFDAAKAAALSYLQVVPKDVAVGIVTFDSDVEVALAPTTNRSDAAVVVNELALSRETLLNDGVIAAVAAAGDTGQRSVLVLSDGADTGSTADLDAVVSSISDANALVDVVSLGQRGTALASLRAMATAGHGQVIESSGDALSAAFQAEADLLASQILVTAPLPDGFDATEATVEVNLPTARGALTASALVPIQRVESAIPSDAIPMPKDPTAGWDVPGWLLYVGIGVLAVGAIALALLLVPAPPPPVSIADRVSAYSRNTAGATDHQPAGQKAASEPVLDQAKAAAAGVLQRNKNLDARLTRRLAAAGSDFKPSEWLLLHVGIVIGATVVGILVGGGNLVVGLIFLVIGFFMPGLYLRWRAGRRRKAFDAQLPQTLQLVGGALSAGLSLAQAVDTVVNEGAEPIASEFKRVLVENRIGVPLETAFEGVAERFQSKDFAWVVMAIRIQRQVGGNLAELLNTVSETMRERQFLRRQVNALAAEGKISAIILSLLPPGVVAWVSLTQPDYLRPMLEEPLGLLMLGAAAFWLLLGVFWMSRLVKVEI